MDKSHNFQKTCTAAAEFLRGLAEHAIVDCPRLELIEDYQATPAKDLFSQLSSDVQSLGSTASWDPDCLRYEKIFKTSTWQAHFTTKPTSLKFDFTTLLYRSIRIVSGEVCRIGDLLYNWKLPLLAMQDSGSILAVMAFLQSWLTASFTWITVVNRVFMRGKFPHMFRRNSIALPDHALTSLLGSFTHIGAGIPILMEIKTSFQADSSMGLDILLDTISPKQFDSLISAFYVLGEISATRPELDPLFRVALPTEKINLMLVQALDFAAFLHETAWDEGDSKEVVEYACRIVHSAEKVFEYRGERVEFCEALITKGWHATI